MDRTQNFKLNYIKSNKDHTLEENNRLFTIPKIKKEKSIIFKLKYRNCWQNMCKEKERKEWQTQIYSDYLASQNLGAPKRKEETN